MTENSKKILVIDDEPDVGEVMKDFLNSQGYSADSTTRAVQGLEWVEKEKPDVVLLDVMMPEIDGIECLKRIRQISPETVVIIISGLQEEKIAKQAIQYGAYDYVTKPFDFHFLQNNLLSRIFL